MDKVHGVGEGEKETSASVQMQQQQQPRKSNKSADVSAVAEKRFKESLSRAVAAATLADETFHTNDMRQDNITGKAFVLGEDGNWIEAEFVFQEEPDDTLATAAASAAAADGNVNDVAVTVASMAINSDTESHDDRRQEATQAAALCSKQHSDVFRHLARQKSTTKTRAKEGGRIFKVGKLSDRKLLTYT